MIPATLTPRAIKALDGSLYVHCGGKCAELRLLDLLPFFVAGRGDQQVRTMVFTCSRCGSPGRASVTWWDGKKLSYDFTSGELKDASLPGAYGP